MRKKSWRSPTIADPRQLHLFEGLRAEDPVLVFNKKLRKIGAWLTYYVGENRLLAGHDHNVLQKWVVAALRQHRDRIIADLLQYEHGIEQHDVPQKLTGGATLHRLPARRPPECEPPVRRRKPSSNHRGPDAA